jgi:hypothetical protein
MKKMGIAALAFALTGCSAGLIDTRGVSHSAYAPANEKDNPGGIVKLECGTAIVTPIIKRCEENGDRIMQDFCEGPFRVNKRNGTLNGEPDYEEHDEKIFGHTVTESSPKASTNEFVFFDCLKGNDAPKSQ